MTVLFASLLLASAPPHEVHGWGARLTVGALAVETGATTRALGGGIQLEGIRELVTMGDHGSLTLAASYRPGWRRSGTQDVGLTQIFHRGQVSIGSAFGGRFGYAELSTGPHGLWVEATERGAGARSFKPGQGWGWAADLALGAHVWDGWLLEMRGGVYIRGPRQDLTLGLGLVWAPFRNPMRIQGD